jgi:hypothetical protein
MGVPLSLNTVSIVSGKRIGRFTLISGLDAVDVCTTIETPTA